MANRRTATWVVILVVISIAVISSASVFAQGGTGKGPILRPPIQGPIGKEIPPFPRPPLCTAQTPKRPTGRTRAAMLGRGVTLETIEIPAGRFCMGSPNGKADERPDHQVAIKQAFYIGKYEVTQAQWQAVMGNNPSSFKTCGNDCPVDNVSWDDVQRFIQNLNQKNDGFLYRLPTEAEWEYACRAGTTGESSGNLDILAWYRKNSGGATHPVGQKQPNAYGLYDMYGNVWEWCQDLYHDNYAGAPTDGSAWLSGRQRFRVLRGGAYTAPIVGSATRYGTSIPPTDIGFRVVAVARTP